MRKFKPKEEIGPEHKYSMTILFKNDHSLPYNFTQVQAKSAEAAVEKAKTYIAKNGYFGSMSSDDVMCHLSAINVCQM